MVSALQKWTLCCHPGTGRAGAGDIPIETGNSSKCQSNNPVGEERRPRQAWQHNHFREVTKKVMKYAWVISEAKYHNVAYPVFVADTKKAAIAKLKADGYRIEDGVWVNGRFYRKIERVEKV